MSRATLSAEASAPAPNLGRRAPDPDLQQMPRYLLPRLLPSRRGRHERVVPDSSRAKSSGKRLPSIRCHLRCHSAGGGAMRRLTDHRPRDPWAAGNFKVVHNIHAVRALDAPPASPPRRRAASPPRRGAAARSLHPVADGSHHFFVHIS